MAYVVSATVLSSGSLTSVNAEIPRDYEDGDSILIVVSQDGGSYTISVANDSAATWSPAFPTGQAGANGQRTYAWIAEASGDMGNVQVTWGGANEQQVVSALVIRGAYPGAPIDVSTVNAHSGGLRMVPGAISTNYDNALLIYGCGLDHSSNNPLVMPGELTHLCSSANGTNAQAIAYRYLDTAGVRPATGCGRYPSSYGGQAFVIAIRDDGSNRRRGEVASLGGIFRWMGNIGATEDVAGDTWEAPTFAASIGGVSVSSNAATITATNAGTQMGVEMDTTAAPLWGGRVQVLAAPLDMSNALFTAGCVFASSKYMTRIGLAFIDGAGNWAMFAPSVLGLSASSTTYLWAIDLENFPATYSSGTVDWTNIAKIGWMRLKPIEAASAAMGFILRRMALTRTGSVTLRGSVNQSDIGLAQDVVAGLDGVHQTLASSSAQGAAQLLTGMPLQFGDGSGTCQLDLAGTQIETVKPWGGSATRRFFMVNGDREVGFSVKAAAGDVVRVRNCLLTASHKVPFVVDSGTSPSAELTFSGSVFIGFAPRNDVPGVVFNDASFISCHTITLSGGGMLRCAVDAHASSPGVSTSDPSNIVDCTFIAPVSGGHAIEITQPGTYTFTGNTFEGYGANGTTDAAIYNNSGGAVTLNITGGGDTPTVRNGTGASTTVNNNVSITLEGVVVGSSIRIERVSDGSLVEFRVAGATTEVFSVSGGANYRVKVRKASSAPKYFPFETQTGTITNDTTIFVQQVLDPIA